MPRRVGPPSNDRWNSVHAEGLRAGRLLLQHCARCGFVRMPPGPICPGCWSEAFRWEPHPGTGHVTSCIWYMRALHPRFPDVPYNVVLVQLDHGAPVLVSSIPDAPPGSVHVGDRVQARFSSEAEGGTVLLFQKEAA